MSSKKSEELFPMHVTPMMFTRGDVVKKNFTDVPYVGVVTAVIPSTNKVEVQWPHGNSLEDPRDLTKVNPLIYPPSVKEDLSYKTYQNQKSQKYNEDYCSKLNLNSVLNDYYNENVQPVLMRSASLYNRGLSKKEAYKILSKEFDNIRIAEEVLDKIFNDSINLKTSGLIDVQDELKIADLELVGNFNEGFTLNYKVGSEVNIFKFESLKDAVRDYKKYQDLLKNLDNKDSYTSVVAHVNRLRKIAKEEK
jgi:hypothetical protein